MPGAIGLSFRPIRCASIRKPLIPRVRRIDWYAHGVGGAAMRKIPPCAWGWRGGHAQIPATRMGLVGRSCAQSMRYQTAFRLCIDQGFRRLACRPQVASQIPSIGTTARAVIASAADASSTAAPAPTRPNGLQPRAGVADCSWCSVPRSRCTACRSTANARAAIRSATLAPAGSAHIGVPGWAHMAGTAPGRPRSLPGRTTQDEQQPA